jgi:hypothetical protein
MPTPTRRHRRSTAVIAALATLDEAVRLTAAPAAEITPEAPVVTLAHLLQLIERLKGGRLYFDRGRLVLDYGVAKIRHGRRRRRARLWPSLAVWEKR